MSRKIFAPKVFVLLLVQVALVLTLARAAEELTVQVKQGQVRERPTYLSKVVAQAPYGQPVSVLEAQGDWRRVETGGAAGWMHSTAMAKPENQMIADVTAPAREASAGEMALAGKGFSKNMEESYRAKHTNLDYTWVDKMETIVVPAESLQIFVMEGDLSLAANDLVGEDGGRNG